MMGRIAGGVAVAAAMAVLMGVPSIAGIETWKWALALAGADGVCLGRAERSAVFPLACVLASGR